MIELTEAAEHDFDGRYTLTGRASNRSGVGARSVSLRADLFDHGVFVAQCTASIDGGIPPGESRYFQIICGCNQKPPLAHDSFKVEVSSIWPT